MPNPKLETYKSKKTGVIYDYTDADAQSKIPSNASPSNKMATASDVASRVPWSANAVLGARNFDPINNLKTETTQQGVKYTPVHDSDGSLQYIIINRESAGTQQAYPDFTLNLRLKAGRYKLACPMEGGEWGLDKMRYYLRYGSTYVTKDSDDDPIFTLTEDTTINFTSVRVEAEYSPSNVKVCPMILLADDTYAGFSPFAMTNRELTEFLTIKESAATNIVEGATVSINKLTKFGKVVVFNFRATGVTYSAWTPMCSIPEGYRPKVNSWSILASGANRPQCVAFATGSIQCESSLSSAGVDMSMTWITE